MPEQTPRQIIAEEVPPIGDPLTMTDRFVFADDVLAAFHEQGIVLCREQVGWRNPDGVIDWQYPAWFLGRVGEPVYVPVEVSS